MSLAWFAVRNAGALRGFLRALILEQFVEQVKDCFCWSCSARRLELSENRSR